MQKTEDGEMATEIRRALEADPPTEAELRAVDVDAGELRRLVFNLRPDVRRAIIRRLSHLPDGAPGLNGAEVDLLFSCLFIEAAGV